MANRRTRKSAGGAAPHVDTGVGSRHLGPGERAVLGALFLTTGATGLVYEITWARLLEHYLGSTQYAVSTVLSVFMLGLALGSAAGGRVADRIQKPLWAYGAAEVVIGIYCLATPMLFHWMGVQSLAWLDPESLRQSGFRGEQFALAAAVLILPTFLMGTTLPLVARAWVRSPREVGAGVSLLYALNTLGAVVGCTATGFVALRWLGITNTLIATGALDILLGASIAVWAIALGPRRPVLESGERKSKPSVRKRAIDRDAAPATLVLVTAALSGFSALAYEVLWFRVLSLVIGSSVYAFTTMLATFLIGIAGGSIALAPRVLAAARPLRGLAILQFNIALFVLVGVALYPLLPALFLALFDALGDRFWLFTLVQSSICAGLMAIPTLCMGATLPVAVQLRAGGGKTIASRIGDVYFLNTAGAISGSLLAGFVLQPWFGIQRSILIVASGSFALGAVLLLASGRGGPERRIATATLGSATAATFAFVGLVWLLPDWDSRKMTLGPYVNQGEVRGFLQGYDTDREVDELLYYREGAHAVISVRRARDGSWLSYQANGKWEGSIGASAPNWSLLGHIPMLLHERPERALLVGLGTGVTLGAMLEHGVTRVDVAEIEPAVVEAAQYFADAHGDALHDDRVHLYATDGRTFVGVPGERYDVIVSGVSDPWISGVSNLFTREFFERISARLNDDGVAAIWLQNYRISQHELKIALATLASAFADVSVWAPHDDPADLMLIARKRPLQIDAVRVFDRIAQHTKPQNLQAAGIRTIFDFVNLLLIENGDLRRFVAGSPLHTDDHPVLEFSLPQRLYTDVHEGIEERTTALMRSARDLSPPVQVPEALQAGFYHGLASTYSYYSYREPHAIALFQRVLEIDPGNESAREYLTMKGVLSR